MHQPRNRTLPQSLGGSRSSPIAICTALSSFALTLWACTEYTAWLLAWNPWLGHPIAPHIYAPQAIIMWAWPVLNPLNHVRYAPIVHQTLEQAGYGLIVGIVISIVLAATIDMIRKPGRPDHLLDSAHFANPKEIKKSRLSQATAGPIIGGYDMQGRKTMPLRYDGELGISYTESPGGGKTSGFLKTNLLIPLRHADAASWSPEERRSHPWGEEPSIIALDIRGDLFAGTSGYQERHLGKDVLRLEPLSLLGETAKYNPFWTIHLGTPHEYDDCYAKTFAIVDSQGEGIKTYWDRAALSFGAACVGKLGYRALNTGKHEIFSLPGLAEYVTEQGSIDALIEDILQKDDDPYEAFCWNVDGDRIFVQPWIVSAAQAMRAKAPEEKSGVYGSFIEFLNLYRSDVLSRNISASTFSFTGLANTSRPVILYITVPPTELAKLRPYLRLLIDDALRELTAEGGLHKGRSVRPHLRSVILALDEIASLRHLDQIENASGFLRGYGIMLWLLWQSIAQQRKYYSENELLTETMDVLLFGRPRSLAGAEVISEMLGEQSVELTKRSHSGGRYSIALTHEQEQTDVIGRPVLTPYEVRGIEKDRLIGFADGLSIYLHKFPYFRNPMLLRRSKLPQSKTSPSLLTHATFLDSVKTAVGTEAYTRITTAVTPTTSIKSAPRPEIDHILSEMNT
jgi:type IV secretion system protein VirD4